MILDSMGWVLFKLNKKEEALIFLLKAFQTFPDGEVAAHLGEVLWALDQKPEAQAIWQQSLQKSPTNKALIDTIKRFIPRVIKSTTPTNETNTLPTTQPEKSTQEIQIDKPQATPENTP
jgi:tetratricopeptide (TPR) repeat protein